MADLARVDASPRGEAWLVTVTGEVDLSNAGEVTAAILGRVPVEASRVVLDLGGLAYLDSAGIAMLFRLAERLGRQRRELRLVVPPGSPVHRVVELVGVARAIPVQPDRDG